MPVSSPVIGDPATSQKGNAHTVPVQGEFLSPCSLRNGYRLEWGSVSAFRPPGHLPPVNREMLEFLCTTGVATRVQLSRFYRGDKKKVAVLAKVGVLVEHRLAGEKRTVIFYTPGPAVALLGFPWTPGWWEQLPLIDVLKRLIANQLYLRFREVAPVKVFPTRPPLTGAMLFNGLDYGIAVVRKGEDGRELRWAEAERLIVVAEELEQALAVAPHIRAPARYTFDRLLFKEPLARAFLRARDGILVPEVG